MIWSPEGSSPPLSPERSHNMSQDRRDFLRLVTSGTAIIAAGGLANEGEAGPSILPDRQVDVAIVGAGLAGLMVAREN